MKVIPFEKLYNIDFEISEPLAKPQYWYHRGCVYNAIGSPKVSHTLLWFKNCSAVITDKSGEVLTVKQNQLTYMAKGSEYRVEFKEVNTDKEDTVVIHFQMHDANGEDIAPSLVPMVCKRNVDVTLAMLIESMTNESRSNIVCIPELKSSLYKLIAEICKSQRHKYTITKYNCISAGIKLMEENSDLKISEIAEQCGVSETYFRRLFKEYSGMSPMDFRQHYRIEKAKQLLMSDEHMTISEIASALNFADIYHFSKTFKKYNSSSPRNFTDDDEA